MLGLLLLAPVLLRAQNPVEMADALRENGKIYIVVGVMALIFIGLCVYLIGLDRRIGKLENNK